MTATSERTGTKLAGWVMFICWAVAASCSGRTMYRAWDGWLVGDWHWVLKVPAILVLGFLSFWLVSMLLMQALALLLALVGGRP